MLTTLSTSLSTASTTTTAHSPLAPLFHKNQHFHFQSFTFLLNNMWVNHFMVYTVFPLISRIFNDPYDSPMSNALLSMTSKRRIGNGTCKPTSSDSKSTVPESRATYTLSSSIYSVSLWKEPRVMLLMTDKTNSSHLDHSIQLHSKPTKEKRQEDLTKWLKCIACPSSQEPLEYTDWRCFRAKGRSFEYQIVEGFFEVWVSYLDQVQKHQAKFSSQTSWWKLSEGLRCSPNC